LRRPQPTSAAAKIGQAASIHARGSFTVAASINERVSRSVGRNGRDRRPSDEGFLGTL
jgi:hypothetical protein